MKQLFSIVADDRFGELPRIVGLCSGRGYPLVGVTAVKRGDLMHIDILTECDDRQAERLCRLLASQVRVVEVAVRPAATLVEFDGPPAAGLVAESGSQRKNNNREDSRMRIYRDSDIGREPLETRTIAVIGYGSQGFAQANNLRDSGFDVVVGLRPDSPSWAKAENAGFTVLEPGDAAARAEVVVMLVPDERMPQVYADAVAPNLRPGGYLGFSHGFAIHFAKVVPPPETNVFMVAPKAPGHLERYEFTQGRGVPCLVAIHQDPSGDTRDVALAYAAGIGGGRAAILETSFREETETDLFGEQAVLCGGVSALVVAGYETLVEAGYAPEMAYFECLHELKLIVDLVYEGGLANMRYSVSNTAEYGDLTRGPRLVDDRVRERMREVLAEIRSGAFADEWMAECEAGGPRFTALEATASEHSLEGVGRRLRSMMPWLEERRLVDRARN